MKHKLLLNSLLIAILVSFSFHDVFAQETYYRSVEVVEAEIFDYGQARIVSDRVLVRLHSGVMDSRAAEIRQQMQAVFEFRIDFVDAEAWRVENGRVPEIIRTWSNHPDIDIIQPDYAYDIPDYTAELIDTSAQTEDGLFPNDPFFDLLWGLNNTGQDPFEGTPGADISAPEAWELETGNPDVIIAVLDTGVDYNHPDLQGNMWQDADGNFGANFAGGPVNDPMDFSGHGTHVAGTVAAVGNNGVGVTGVMWEADIMAVRVCNEDTCPLSAIAQGLEYAIENGARISNNSYGTQTPTASGPAPLYVTMMENAQQQGHFYITSAGNANNDNDVLNVYPANLMLDFDNVFSVGNSTPDDTRSPGSNFGNETVHLFAPGTNIASTFLDNDYFYLTGTSMASPHVAGIAGLLLSRNPGADYHFLRDRLMDGADEVDALENFSIAGGRANALQTLLAADVPIIQIFPESLSFQVTESGQQTREIEVSNPGNQPLEVEVSALFDNGSVTIETGFQGDGFSQPQSDRSGLLVEAFSPDGGLLSDTPLTASPGTFTVEPGGTAEVSVTFDAAGLDFGTYSGEIIFSSNAENEPEISVPVSASVVVGDVITLWEQLPEGNQGIMSGYFPPIDVAVYAADDFELDDTAQLTFLSARGFQVDQDLVEDVLIEVSFYVFGDDNGVPAGNPDEAESTLFTHTAQPGDSGFEVIQNDFIYTFELDLVDAGLDPLILNEGVYWLAAVPSLDLNTLAGESRWNWYRGEENLNEPVLLDRDNVFGSGFTDWTTFSDVGLDWSSLGLVFTIQGFLMPDAAPVMSVTPEEFNIELEEGSEASATLTISNTGDAPLSVDLEALFSGALQNQSVLTLSETSFTIQPGGERQLTLGVDASDLSPGSYSGEIQLSGNDPETPELTVPVSLEITGEVFGPLMSIQPESLTLSGEIPETVTAELEFSNPGDQTLTVELSTLLTAGRTVAGPDSGTDSDAFTVTPSSLSIPGGESVLVTAALDAGQLEAGTYDGTINAQSNAATNPSQSVPVDVIVIEPDQEPGSFTLQSPEDGATIEVDPNTDGVVVFEWEASSNTESYTMMLAGSSQGFDDPLLEFESDTDGTAESFTISDVELHAQLTNAGFDEGQTHAFFWSVRAEGPGGETLADAPFEINVELLAGQPEPQPFSLLAPEDGAEFVTVPEDEIELVFEWEASENADSYTWLAYEPDGSADNPLLSFDSDEDGTATSLTFTLTELNDLLTAQGVEEGDETTWLWTVIAGAGVMEQEAEEAFEVNLVRGAAFILVEPTELEFQLPEGESGQQSFTLINEGFIDLAYELFPAEVAWLELESELSGVIGPGNSEEIQVSAHAAELAPGDYSANIQIESNDPDQPIILLEVFLEVMEGTRTGDEPELPESVQLYQNYPNPFNPATTIRFALPESGEVRLEVFNMMGEQVALLENGSRGAGYHTIEFNAANLASGIYLYRLQSKTPEAGKQVLVKKMTLIK